MVGQVFLDAFVEAEPLICDVVVVLHGGDGAGAFGVFEFLLQDLSHEFIVWNSVAQALDVGVVVVSVLCLCGPHVGPGVRSGGATPHGCGSFFVAQ